MKNIRGGVITPRLRTEGGQFLLPQQMTVEGEEKVLVHDWEVQCLHSENGYHTYYLDTEQEACGHLYQYLTGEFDPWEEEGDDT